MDKEQEIIIETLQAHTNAWKSIKGLRAILADCIPEKKALRNVLCYAYEEGIVEVYNSKIDLQQFRYRYKKILQNDYAVVEKQAEWAVETWLYILQQDAESDDCHIENNNPSSSELNSMVIDMKKFDRMKLALMECVYEMDIKKYSERETAHKFIKIVKRILEDD